MASVIDCFKAKSVAPAPKPGEEAEAPILDAASLRKLEIDHTAAVKKYRSRGFDEAAAIKKADREMAEQERLMLKRLESFFQQQEIYQANDFNVRRRVEALNAARRARMEEKNSPLAKWFYNFANKKEYTYGQVYRDMLSQAWHRGERLEVEFVNDLAVESGLDNDALVAVIKDPLQMESAWRAMAGDKNVKGDAAKVGQAFRKVLDKQHMVWHAAGGVGGDIKNFHPHIHNVNRLREQGFDAFKDSAYKHFDFDRMINPKTKERFGTDAKQRIANLEAKRKASGAKLTPSDEAKIRRWEKEAEQERADFLNAMYKDIVSEGGHSAANRARQGISRGKTFDLFEARQRSVRFKSTDDFISYNAGFGTGSDKNGTPQYLFDVMMGHISQESRTIATMQVLGPAAHSAHRFHAAFASEHPSFGNMRQRELDGMFSSLTGSADLGSPPGWYDVVTEAQGWLRAGLLGGASISSLPDLRTPGTVLALKGLTRHMGAFGAGGQAVGRVFNRSSGKIPYENAHIIMTALNYRLSGAARYGGEGAKMGSASTKATNVLFRINGLQQFTDGLADVGSMGLAGDMGIALSKGEKFADFPEGQQDLFQKFGIAPHQWDELVESGKALDRIKTVEETGQFLHYGDLFDLDEDLAQKLGDIDAHMRMLVTSSPDLRMRTWSTGAFLGEGRGGVGSMERALFSSLMLFKSFPIQIMRNVLFPLLKQVADGKMSLAGAHMITALSLGAMTFWLKEELAGREVTPEAFTTPGNVARIVTYSGAMGMGDLLLQSQGWGRNVTTSAMGPVAGVGADILGIMQSAAVDTAELTGWIEDTDKAHFNRAVGDFIGRYAPFNNLWYAAQAQDRLIYDNVSSFLDPDFSERMARREADLYRETGQELRLGTRSDPIVQSPF